jgi:hypothetical protein
MQHNPMDIAASPLRTPSVMNNGMVESAIWAGILVGGS